MLKFNDLVGYKNRKIYQDSEAFCFSIDSILIANFVTLGKQNQKVLDIGSGNAPIPLILTLRKENIEIDAIEIQESSAKLAEMTIEYNKLESKINLYNEDILKLYKKLQPNSYDVIVCNPPFFKTTNIERISQKETKAFARHEITLELEDCFIIVNKLLKDKGNFAMVHRVMRFEEVINLYKKYNLKISKIQFVYSNKDSDAMMFLIEGVKGKGARFKILNPFILYDENNNKTSQHLKLLEEVSK